MKRLLATTIGSALILIGLSSPQARAAGTRAKSPGIDISHWQGAIDWAKVANAGIKFVIAKATESTDFQDPNYSSYRQGATNKGILFTAYHFARPDTGANDAVKEADFFVNTAALQAGNLKPALDLEVTGGLGVTALQNWVQAWLDEVHAKLGAKPMIYTSPNFWKTYVGDTSKFADEGYKLLWIAHWGVSKPSVPGNNWGGHGWTFWQYTSTGSVPGISGNVDRDWYHGTDFTKVTIH